MSPRPEAAFVEIVERRTASYDPDERGPRATIRPNEVRINGTPLLVPNDEQIVVHETRIDDDDLVRVTLTMWVRRVVIGQEAADGAEQ